MIASYGCYGYNEWKRWKQSGWTRSRQSSDWGCLRVTIATQQHCGLQLSYSCRRRHYCTKTLQATANLHQHSSSPTTLQHESVLSVLHLHTLNGLPSHEHIRSQHQRYQARTVYPSLHACACTLHRELLRVVEGVISNLHRLQRVQPYASAKRGGETDQRQRVASTEAEGAEGEVSQGGQIYS